MQQREGQSGWNNEDQLAGWGAGAGAGSAGDQRQGELANASANSNNLLRPPNSSDFESSANAASQSVSSVIPIHVSAASARIAISGGFNVLTGDGLVAFRHAKAFATEQSLSTDQQAANRKERARILSRLMNGDGTLTTPPNKGTTMVISIPVNLSQETKETNEDCATKLRRVLYLLGTYYNVFILLAVTPDTADALASLTYQKEQELREKMIKRLRGDDEDGSIINDSESSPDKQQIATRSLSADVIPDHRIILSTTVTGRVAFVRQLHRVELVLDFDPEVRNLLSRFGHKVIVYGQSTQQNGVSSKSEDGSRVGVCDCLPATNGDGASPAVCLGKYLLP